MNLFVLVFFPQEVMQATALSMSIFGVMPTECQKMKRKNHFNGQTARAT